MEFPTIFYRKPGPYAGPGMTYDTIGVTDSAQAVALIDQGWKATFAELLETPPDPVEIRQDPVVVPEEVSAESEPVDLPTGPETANKPVDLPGDFMPSSDDGFAAHEPVAKKKRG